MSLTMPSIIKFLLFFSLVGCSLTQEQKKKTSGPEQRAFKASFEQVWRATQLALARYPIRVNNMDVGVIETEFIKGYDGIDPFQKKNFSGGRRYKLTVRVIKGKLKRKKAIKVLVIKQAEIQRDFFSNVEKVTSDSLEELAVLYRIKREIEIEKALERMQKRKKRRKRS